MQALNPVLGFSNVQCQTVDEYDGQTDANINIVWQK